MPKAHAAMLAKTLLDQNPADDPLVVDVVNDGFIQAVKVELERLGHTVEKDPFKDRLTIYRIAY